MVSPEPTNWLFDYALIDDIPVPDPNFSAPASGFSWAVPPFNASSNVRFYSSHFNFPFSSSILHTYLFFLSTLLLFLLYSYVSEKLPPICIYALPILIQYSTMTSHTLSWDFRCSIVFIFTSKDVASPFCFL